MCIGEALSLDRLFLFASCILQSFTLLPADDQRKPFVLDSVNSTELEQTELAQTNISSENISPPFYDAQCDPRLFNFGLILEPQPYQIRVIPRKKLS